MRLGTVLVPVAVYFLVLGVLNSRRHPQVLTGRRDFALLVVALSPMVVLPVLGYLGLTLPATAAMLCLVVAGAVGLAPRGGSWVIYNLSPDEARRLVARTAAALDLPVTEGPGEKTAEARPCVQIRCFSLLRNVTVRLHHGDRRLRRRFERALVGSLSRTPAQTSPMATMMLLVATAMLSLPLALVVGRASEIVRLISGMLD